MSDEVMAAVERVRAFEADRANWTRTPPEVAIARADLARAYIAEHPADEHDPIDEAWLRSVGFEQKEAYWIRHLPPQSLRSSAWAIVVHDGVWMVDIRSERAISEGGLVYSWLTACKSSASRGQLRMLCMALQIPLTEKAKP